MATALAPIVQAAKEGDRRALNALAACVDRYLRMFSGRLSHKVRRSQGSTIDFVLEGFAEALSRLADFEYRSDEEFYAWVSRHIRNRIVSAGRAEGREKRAGAAEALGDRDDDVESAAPTGSQLFANDEVRSALAQAVLDLQLEHAEAMEVVLMKVFESRSWSEVQEALGLSSMKRARTLFAEGIDLLRPKVEKALGKPALWEHLGL